MPFVATEVAKLYITQYIDEPSEFGIASKLHDSRESTASTLSQRLNVYEN